MKTEFKPWEQKPGLPPIAVEGPPCVRCEHWNPQPQYRKTPTGQVPDGVILCHRGEMFSDFSCFQAGTLAAQDQLAISIAVRSLSEVAHDLSKNQGLRQACAKLADRIERAIESK